MHLQKAVRFYRAKNSKLAYLENGTHVSIEVTSEGVMIRPKLPKTRNLLPYSEAELLKGLTPHTAHVDELPLLTVSEREGG